MVSTPGLPTIHRRYAGFMVSKSQRQVSREHTGRLARQLSPSELSTAVRIASQGPRKNDLRMWREYAEATLFNVSSLQPNHMAFIANGFARAQVPDREVFNRMSDQAFRQVDHFEPRDTALFLNAYAKLQFRDKALFKVFSKAIQRSSSVGYGEQQLSLLCNAYARLEIADTDLFKKLGRWTARRVVELTPQGVATVANAYAKVLISDETLFAALREGIGRNAADFKAQHLANLLNAFAKLELREEQVALGKLATQIPSRARDFQPIELSQALHALVKLEMASEHRRAVMCLAEAIQEKAEDFHSRQLALSLHSFSMLNSSYNRLFESLAPHVVSTLGMADHQSAALIFCAYARAGEVNGEVMQALLETLQRSIADAGEQMQVQLFYACGRFGLYKEPLTITLAQLLRENVLTLSGQHLANCLLTLSRLSLCNEQFSSLQAALQARLLRRDVDLEPQHVANSLHALAGIYGDGAPAQISHTPLPGPVVPRLIDFVVQSGSRWQQVPQLLASVAIDSAKLRQASPELLTLVSQTVRQEAIVKRGTQKLTKPIQSDLLWSFAVSGVFDLDFFSWALSQLDTGSLASVPLDSLLTVLYSLDYVSFSGQIDQINQEENMEPEEWQGEKIQSLLFMQCPASFQKQAFNFYERVGLTVLLHSPNLPAVMLQNVAPSFARAGLLHVVPLDLVSPETSNFFAVAANALPGEPLRSEVKESQLQEKSGEAAQSLMDFFLEELSIHGGSSSSSSSRPGVRQAELLVRYAKLLPEMPGSEQSLQTPSVPSAVLDPLLRKLGAVLRDAASELSFKDLAATLATLADAGIRPHDVWEALTTAAEACDFPTSTSTPDSAEHVAAFFYGHDTGRSSRHLQERLGGFLKDLSQVSEGQKLGRRPLQTLARLMVAAEADVLQQQASAVASLLQTAMEADPTSRSFDDLTDLLYALDQVCVKLPPGSAPPDFATLNDCSELLQRWLCDAVEASKPEKCLELLHTLSLSRSGSTSLELLETIAAQMLSQSQVLGGAGLVFGLQAFGRLQVLRRTAGNEPQELKLPRLVASLLRSLLVLERRLSIRDAAIGAHFCAHALDAPLLTDAERVEAKDGLARLLERLSWEQKRWSLEDRKLLIEVATLLRSEYPELLHSKWVPALFDEDFPSKKHTVTPKNGFPI